MRRRADTRTRCKRKHVARHTMPRDVNDAPSHDTASSCACATRVCKQEQLWRCWRRGGRAEETRGFRLRSSSTLDDVRYERKTDLRANMVRNQGMAYRSGLYSVSSMWLLSGAS